MNQKALNALEYPKIIEKLTEKASSYMGKQLCKNLEPSTDLETIRLMQVQTKDALTRLFQKGSISFGNVKAVSYTHLDVYKRQAMDCMISANLAIVNGDAIR